MKPKRSLLAASSGIFVVLLSMAVLAGPAEAKKKRVRGGGAAEVTAVVNQVIPDAVPFGFIGVRYSTLEIGASSSRAARSTTST